ncbi:nucleotidyl transferase AbiEii/AbiGii toxin family protein [Pseudomonas viridiflava]|uniref:nucleotidyl transferase AbiEii/AbiGii toxin family protein n=1 Tax=Pseudomonas viridiflava TaxID=33069 RepID=UPI0018E5DA7D|nr:nucleotidyl transferase AbiEii/AbiGii toxin family protein [Pseudomonas viridiflava]MBI6725699.1 nucleotidyl transferase AbiEii/AbiGii toxin family protein [Pseudomonas viridiflava]
MDKPTLNLTDDEKTHVLVMRSIARAFNDTPMVLKGGTALLLGYGLNRFSEDLDYNSPVKLNLESKIRSARPIGVVFDDIKLSKNTDTTTRFKVDYTSGAFSRSVKLDISHREGIAPSQITVIDGIKMYKPSVLIDQKLRATEGRQAIRDLFDLNFLSKHYPGDFSRQNIADYQALTRDINSLDSLYRLAYETDVIVSDAVDYETLILESHEGARSLSSQGPTVIKYKDNDIGGPQR